MDKKVSGEIVAVQPVAEAESDLDSLLPLSASEAAKMTTTAEVQKGTKIKIFTLNCWGIRVISKDREERFRAIAEYLLRSDYDVVFLQEIWLNEDYRNIANYVFNTFPFSHSFDSGIIGSGTCVFSRSRLQEANFHEFGINGYPTNFYHGDWFAAKGIGVCQITYHGYHIHLYVSHYHANYNPKNDIYLSHRVSHAFESAQWIKLASGAADLTIYAGDFNTDPMSLPYKLLRSVASLDDAWVTANNKGEDSEMRGGETSETEYNSYTFPNESNKNNGHRIDYILYTAGPNISARATECLLPLPHKIPGYDFSYSDHEGVEATITLSRTNEYSKHSNPAVAYRRLESQRLRTDTIHTVHEAMKIMDRGLRCTEKYQSRYVVISLVMSLLIVATFIPGLCFTGGPVWVLTVLDFTLFIPRFALTTALIIFALMGTLFTKRERNALISCKKHLKLVLDQDNDEESE